MINIRYMVALIPSLCLLQVSDTGQYVCKASNVAGQVDKNFHLNIYSECAHLIAD